MATPRGETHLYVRLVLLFLTLLLLAVMILYMGYQRRTSDADVARAYDASKLEIAIMEYFLDKN